MDFITIFVIILVIAFFIGGFWLMHVADKQNKKDANDK